MKGRVRGALVLVAVQAALVGTWWGVQRAREAPTQLPAVASPSQWRSASAPAPALTYVGEDGVTGSLSDLSGRVVVHFWATWCPPCVHELPALLQWSGDGATVLAVSVDPGWGAVREFLGDVPARVVRAPPATAVQWGADALPATFLVQDGRVLWEVRGAVDWEAAELPW